MSDTLKEKKQIKLRDAFSKSLRGSRSAQEPLFVKDVKEYGLNKNYIPLFRVEDFTSNEIDFKLDLHNLKYCIDLDKSTTEQAYKQFISAKMKYVAHVKKLKPYRSAFLELIDKFSEAKKESPSVKIEDHDSNNLRQRFLEGPDTPEKLPMPERIIEQEALLISGYGRKFEYCIFKPTPEFPRIAISENIYAAYLNAEVLPEYVCIQFKENPNVKKQTEDFFKLYRYSSYPNNRFMGICKDENEIKQIKEKYEFRIKYVKNEQLLNISIDFVSLEEQRKVVSDYKDRLVKKLHKTIYKINKEKISEDYQFADSMAHNINNKLSPLSESLIQISDYLNRKELLNELIDIPQDEDDKVETVKDCLNRCLNQSKSIADLIKSTREILTRQIPKDKFVACNIRQLCNEIKKDNTSKDFVFKVSGEEAYATIHKTSFKEAVECMLSNAKAHAWLEGEQKVFELEVKKDIENQKVIIICRNSGAPFPNDFSIKEYRKLLGKSAKSKGTGNGGAWVDKFLNAHNGDLEIKPLGEHKGTEFKIILPLM